jgi:hypothetical protein
MRRQKIKEQGQKTNHQCAESFNHGALAGNDHSLSSNHGIAAGDLLLMPRMSQSHK